MQRSLGWLALFLVLASTWARTASPPGPEAPSPEPPAERSASPSPAPWPTDTGTGTVTEEFRHGVYRLVVLSFGRGKTQQLLLYRGDRLVMRQSPDWSTQHFPDKLPFRDLDGDGRVELLHHAGSGFKSVPGLTAWSLAGSPRRLFHLEGNLWPEVVDVDRDGSWEVRVTDHGYGDFRTCWADQPRPHVILRWQGGRLQPDLELMRVDVASWTDPAPSAADVARDDVFLAYRTLTPRHFRGSDQVPVVTSHVLTLLYRGRADEAFRFLEESGWERRHGKYRGHLLAAMRRSRWWPAVRVLNKGQLHGQ